MPRWNGWTGDGSNTFDLLVAIPLGVLIVGAAPVDFAIAVPMMGVLTVATILLFAVLRTDLSLSGVESYALLVAYVRSSPGWSPSPWVRPT